MVIGYTWLYAVIHGYRLYMVIRGYTWLYAVIHGYRLYMVIGYTWLY